MEAVSVHNTLCNHYKHYCGTHRIIKHSAPHMNSTVVFGCFVLLLGSLFLGIDSNHPVFGGVDLFHSYFAAICTVKLSLNN